MQYSRVVITGIGVISPLGNTLETYWQNLINGVSGIRKISQFDASELPCQIAGEIPEFNPQDFMDKKLARRIPRCAQIALASAVQAISDAQLTYPLDNGEQAAISYGTGMGGFDWADIGIQTLRTKGLSKVNPFSIPGSIPNLPAYVISQQLGCYGPSMTITTACASGTQAIGYATDLIRTGKAKIVISGGTEALVKDFSIAGFSAMRALPTHYNDHPTKASRPFDKKREGFVFSEGSATLIIEELDHALRRGAKIYAEILGHAETSDAYSITAPDPHGQGAVMAMRNAIEDAHITPDNIDYINAHGTSTPLNDKTETMAIKKVFAEKAYNIPISSIKSMIGHPMGASGALEAVATVMAITTQILPPTINYEYPDPECDLDYVPNTARQHPVTTALSNSFGLGGQNACIILQKYKKDK